MFSDRFVFWHLGGRFGCGNRRGVGMKMLSGLEGMEGGKEMHEYGISRHVERRVLILMKCNSARFPIDHVTPDSQRCDSKIHIFTADQAPSLLEHVDVSHAFQTTSQRLKGGNRSNRG